MEIIKNIDQIDKPFENAVITIGNFDGVHLGHQSLLNRVVKKAEQINGRSIAMTFDPHPLKILGVNPPPVITRIDQKTELIKACGIDVLLCFAFDRGFSLTSAHDFVEHCLVKKLGMKIIIIGPDYTFGKNKQGNVDLLKELGEKFGFQTIVSSTINISEHKDLDQFDRISSTKIREIVMQGDVNRAKKYLGRYYQIRGKVIVGRKRGGSQLGFPTANIKLHDELCPKFGVYAVIIETIKGNFKGVANIGISPTFDDKEFTIEVHILNFDYDIYNTKIRVNIVERLRDEIKFHSIEKLSSQIFKDIEVAKKILR